MQKYHHRGVRLLTACVLVCCAAQLGCQNNKTKDSPDLELKAMHEPKAMLNEQLKSQYRDQLKRDPNKEFSPEFVRTTDLERALIDEHGFDAIKLVFEDRNSANYFPLGEFPAECPWADLNGKSIEAAIGAVLDPISDRLPTLIGALKSRCKYLYAERNDETWTLHYFLDMVLYDGRKYYHIYSGGEPNPRPEANTSLVKYRWNVPDDLKRLYAIHDGFGPILSSGEITILATIMDPVCKAQNTRPEGYSFADLLEFHPDGGGNAQCFHRQGDSMATVDWDHETWEISDEQDFFDYVDQRLSELDEE